MTKLAPEWVRTSDPVIRSPARYRWTTAPANSDLETIPYSTEDSDLSEDPLLRPAIHRIQNQPMDTMQHHVDNYLFPKEKLVLKMRNIPVTALCGTMLGKWSLEVSSPRPEKAFMQCLQIR